MHRTLIDNMRACDTKAHESARAKKYARALHIKNKTMSTPKYNTAYSIDVLRRMYDEKELKAFHEEYIEHCRVTRHTVTPSKADMRALTMYREGMTISEISQNFNVKHHVADAMVNRSARYLALGGELSAIK